MDLCDHPARDDAVLCTICTILCKAVPSHVLWCALQRHHVGLSLIKLSVCLLSVTWQDLCLETKLSVFVTFVAKRC